MNYSCEYKPDPIPRLENIYTYPDADKYIPKQYNTYSEIKGGEISYFPNRRVVLDNFRNPNFKNGNYINSKMYIDPMGSIKPQYNMTLTKDKYKGQLTWIQHSCEHREDLMALQMRKDNQTRYEPRWNFN